MNKLATKISLFVLTAVIITLILPSEGLLNLAFTKGGKWDNKTLYSPFEFPIYKSQNQLSAERRDVLSRHIPVFIYDSMPQMETLRKVRDKYGIDNLNDSITQSSKGAKLLGLLSFIYKKGVLADASDATSEYIRITESNNMYTVASDELFTVATAIEYLRKHIGGDAEQTYISPNIFYDKQLNSRISDMDMKRISLTEGIIHKGELIVSEGQFIDDNTFRILESFRTAYRHNIGSGAGRWAIDTGHLVIVLLILLLNFMFLTLYRVDYAKRLNTLLFMLFMYILMVGLTVAMASVASMSVYAIPFSVLGIFLVTFFDSRTAMFGLISALLISAMAVPNSFQFVSLNFLAGMMGIFIMRHTYRRHNVFRAAAYIFGTYSLGYMAMSMLESGSFSDIVWTQYIWFGVNVLLVLACYQLVYLFEKIFGFVSDITLLELCDTNQPLLQRLARNAPGTFQHSVQVANLAESAATEIGANPMLARTGALYHDVGKLSNPNYFIENQAGDYNPHDSITPSESVDIIRKHVTDGLKIARRYKLPAKIQEFIASHHGNYLIYYFYVMEKEAVGESNIDMQRFSYPGPLPVSREVSICMLADAIEAVSRTLKSFQSEDIAAAIDKIVDKKITDGQLSHSLLSFSDIEVMRKVFKEKLNNIYHGRIEYPE